MHASPFHFALPRLPTIAGMFTVSSSWMFRRMPSLDRKPTMILGTPRRKDWIQNFMSFRSKLSESRSDWISAVVLSSTQLTGAPGSAGFESHTGIISAQLLPSGTGEGNYDIGPTHSHRPRRLDTELFVQVLSVRLNSTAPCCLLSLGPFSQ
jgi:hypothetical protein